MSSGTDILAFGGLSPKKLASLGKRIVKTKRACDIGDKLEKAFGDWDVGHDALWHLTRHGTVSIADNLEIAIVLRDDLGRDSEFDRDSAIEAILVRLTPDLPPLYALMEGLPEPVYRLAQHLVQRDPERAKRVYPEAPPNAQAALALAMTLEEMELPAGAAERLTSYMASLLGKPEGLRSGPALQGRLNIDRLAAKLGTTKALDEAALERMSNEDNSWTTPRGMAGALRTGEHDVVLLGLNGFMRVNGHISDYWEEVRAALRERHDLPDLARDLAQGRWAGIAGEKQRILLFRLFEVLPDGLEDSLTFHCLDFDGYRPEYEAILELVGQERAFALARRALDEPGMHPPSRRTWIPALVDVFGSAAQSLRDEAAQQGLA